MHDANTVVWDVASGKVLNIVVHPHVLHLRSIAFSPDGKWLATCGGRYVRISETTTGKLLHAVRKDNFVRSLQFSPSGKQLAIGDTAGVKLVDAESGELLHQLDAPGGGRPKFVFSKDGRLLARMGAQVPIWSTQTGKKLFELHTAARDGSFSDDGRRFAVGFSDRKTGLAVWQLSGGAVDAGQGDEPAPESGKDKVEENTPYRGKKAAQFIDGDKSDDTKKSEDTGETKAKRDRFSLHVEKLSKEQVEQLAWGKESHGLRAALLFEPQKNIVAMGDILKQSYVVRNAGETPLELTATPWLSTDLTKLEVVDQDGKAIAVERISYSGAMPLDTCTLRPGEAVKIPLRDMSIGAGKFDDPWPDIVKPTPGQTCRLRGQLSIERVALADGDDADESSSFWLGAGVVEFRVTDQDDTAADFSKRRRTN